MNRPRSWSGFAFAVLFVAGLVPLGELIGSFGDSDATFSAYFASSSNKTATLVGGAVLALAGLTFLWFLAHLRNAFESSGPLRDLITASGTAFVVLLFVADAALVTVPFARAFGGAFDERAILRAGESMLPQLGYVLLAVFAMWAAALMILATTISARRAGDCPRWLSVLGFGGAAFVFLLGPSVIGLLGLPVWVVAHSIHRRLPR